MCRSSQVIVADEVTDRADVVGQVLRKGQRRAHQTREPLPQGAVEPFNMIGVSGLLGDHPVLGLGNDPAVRRISVCVKRRVLAIDGRELVPEPLRTLAAAIADMKRKALAAAGVQGQPQPLLLAFLPTKLHSSSASASKE